MSAERLQRVAMELADAVSTGKKLPVVQRADAAGLTGVMHAQLDAAIAERDREIGARMACHKGCSACCVSPVVVTEGESIAVAEWLKQPENAAARAHYESTYPAWRSKMGELVAEAGQSRDADANLAWCMKAKRREAMCAFNKDGACTVYPVRPALCRKTHALDTNAHCGPEGGQVSYYQHPATENVYDAQHEMRFALHEALRGQAQPELLPAAVHRLLSGTVVGRNDLCPCGSGKKYKKCHGA